MLLIRPLTYLSLLVRRLAPILAMTILTELTASTTYANPTASTPETSIPVTTYERDSADPNITIETTTVEANVPVSQSQVSTRATAATNCKRATAYRTYKAAGVVVLYQLTLRMEWCYNGNSVVGTPVKTVAQNATTPWSFVGYTSDPVPGRISNATWKGYVQAKMQMVDAGIIRVERYPYVEMWVKGSGKYEYETGG